MNENLKDQDILLVKEKGSNELKVANKDGKIKPEKPDNGNNPDFLKIDRNGIGNAQRQRRHSRPFS